MSARSSTSRGTRGAHLTIVALLAMAVVEGRENALAATPKPPAPPVAKATTELLRKVGWLTGCWERRVDRWHFEEQWMEPRGGTMLGMGRTTRGDTLVEYEQVRIFERAGKLIYAAHPSGQTPAEFVSTVVGDSVIVFENKAHDFPQRITYCRTGLDSLLATVEGKSKGRRRAVEFPYVHIACPSGGPSPTR
jgi:hypothetical protein